VDSFEDHAVLALPHEDFPFEVSFTKKVFVSEAAKGGFRNKKRTFVGVAKWATLVSLHQLPQQVFYSVLEGNCGCLLHMHFPPVPYPGVHVMTMLDYS